MGRSIGGDCSPVQLSKHFHTPKTYADNILYGASIAVRGWKRRQRFGLRDRIYLAVKLSGGERRIISGTNDLLGYFAC